MSRKDRITPALWDYVYEREGGICLARKVDPNADACRGQWGDPVRWRNGRMHRADVTYAHVKSHARMGKRAEPDARHGVLECWHHNGDGWSSAHRNDEREYLEAIEGERRDPERVPER